jgi:hypothetical protein
MLQAPRGRCSVLSGKRTTVQIYILESMAERPFDTSEVKRQYA